MTKILSWTLAILAVTAADARAQMTMGTFRGYLTAHVGAISGSDLTNERPAIGGSVAVQEATGWGAELDVAHSKDAVFGQQSLDVTTYMLNGSWVRPQGMVRPFGLAGAGVMQVNGCRITCSSTARTYDLGLNAGAGAFVVLHDSVAVRADARYFYTGADHPDLGRPSQLTFWRLSIGATFMWALQN